MTVASVVIADDQDLVRDGIRVVLDAEPDLRVVGEAADGEDAVRVVAATRPDLVLVDIRMPVLDGIEATRRILATPPSPYVMVLTTFDLDEYVLAALHAGASGFLLKDAPRARIVEAVRRILSGEAFLAPTVMGRLIEHFVQTQPVAKPVDRTTPLTGRETDVLTLLAGGSTNSEIARALFIGESTVKSYVSNIFGKLGARDRVQATIAAYDLGLVGRSHDRRA